MDKKLLNTTDAQVWAREFMQRWSGCTLGTTPVEIDLLIVWFANAIEVGRDAGRSAALTHADARQEGYREGMNEAARICSELDVFYDNSIEDSTDFRLLEGKREGAKRCTEAILRALRSHQAPSRDAGWVMVPMEPTHDMLEAFVKAWSYMPRNYVRSADARIIDCWNAMLAAAPGAGKGGERGR